MKALYKANCNLYILTLHHLSTSELRFPPDIKIFAHYGGRCNIKSDTLSSYTWAQVKHWLLLCKQGDIILLQIGQTDFRNCGELRNRKRFSTDTSVEFSFQFLVYWQSLIDFPAKCNPNFSYVGNTEQGQAQVHNCNCLSIDVHTCQLDSFKHWQHWFEHFQSYINTDRFYYWCRYAGIYIIERLRRLSLKVHYAKTLRVD